MKHQDNLKPAVMELLDDLSICRRRCEADVKIALIEAAKLVVIDEHLGSSDNVYNAASAFLQKMWGAV